MNERAKAYPPHRPQEVLKDGWREFLANRYYTHHVTLSMNDPTASTARMRAALKAWDARFNRSFLGKRWRKKPDERALWIAFPESVSWHPHWHLLMQLLPGQEEQFHDRLDTLEACVERCWRRVTFSGSSCVRKIETGFVKHYVTKQLNYLPNTEHIVTSRELYEL